MGTRVVVGGLTLGFFIAACTVAFFGLSDPALRHPRLLMSLLHGEGINAVLRGGEQAGFFVDTADQREVFRHWMQNADISVEDGEPVQSLKAKLVHRLLLFCYDVLPSSITDQYKTEIADIDLQWAARRRLTPTEEAIKAAIGAASPDVVDVTKGLGNPESFNYFGFIPQDKGRLIPGSSSITWETQCWKEVSASTAEVSDGWEVSVHVTGPKHLICSDFHMFATASSLHVGLFPTPIPGTKKFKFHSAKLTQSEIFDVQTNGVRAFRFRDGPIGLVRDLFETVLLFVPEVVKTPPAWTARYNLDFLKRYAGREMKERVDTGGVVLDESEIHSGDFLGIIRLDGLDPMLAWAMGSTTGHTTVAIWEDNQLYIAESQAKGAYWDVNGIQRTPYRQWISQARAAGYSVVHAPLAKKYRDMFDEKAANAFFHSQESLNYGYAALLVGWIDTVKDNYPCLPPYDGKHEDRYCLNWPLIETLFPLASKFAAAVDTIYLEAWNQHVTGSPFSGLGPVEIYQAARKKGLELANIFTIVEQDGTQYSQIFNNGTKTVGTQMVCDVFVCFMWKAGGLFKEINDNFNCVEQTNNDIYNLDFLSPPEQLPPQCVAADPDNKLCQLMGRYELQLPTVGTRRPYAHMHETCPSMAPQYKEPTTC